MIIESNIYQLAVVASGIYIIHFVIHIFFNIFKVYSLKIKSS